MITPTRVDRYYDVTGCDNIDTPTTKIRPDHAHVVHYGDGDKFGQPVSVYVRGPIVRKDKGLSAKRAPVCYGRFGIPVDQAPDWVRTLAATPGVEPAALQP